MSNAGRNCREDWERTNLKTLPARFACATTRQLVKQLDRIPPIGPMMLELATQPFDWPTGGRPGTTLATLRRALHSREK